MRAHPSPGSEHATLATTGPGAGGLPRHLPRLAGHQHRQRRPADPAAGAGHRHGRSAVGDQRVCHRVVGPDAVSGPARRSLWASADVAAQRGHLHPGVVAVRLRRQPADAGGRARGAGHRRCAADSQRHADPQPCVPRSAPACARDRGLVGIQCAGPGTRPAVGRRAGAASRLDEHLPDQPVAGPACPHARCSASLHWVR
ncbi:hypothetical protein G6F22_010509 [Rhizopus arrhizus]|nr:hypothetical protein G6F22_010509 [Rhizopus arrhizus]